MIAKLVFRSLILVFIVLTLAGCQRTTETTAASANTTATTDTAAPAQDEVARNIATFDDLDFNVFSNQKWDELSRSHHKDILVHWPDGHTTTGIEKHIEDLKAMFVYAPDTRIKEHPIKIGQGELTAVTGIMEGTFTKPMPMPGGKSAKPTGKSFKLPMCTVGRWKDGVMVEEYLYWDNQTYMQQLGLAK